MSRICHTCKYWCRNGRAQLIALDLKSAADIFDDEDTAHRRCLKIIHSHVVAAPSEPAVVTDGSGYAAALYTLPSFGCLLWEPAK